MRKIYILQSVASIFHPLSHPCSPILSPQGNSHNESKLSRLQLLVLSSTFESFIHWTTGQEIFPPFMGQVSPAKIPGYKSWPCYKFSSSSPDSPQICSVRLSSPSTALIGDNPLTEIPLPPPSCDNQRLCEQVMAWHTPSVQSKQDQREPISIQIICSVITRFVIEAKQ